MAKGGKGKSKTDVTARQQLKNQQLTCRYCGQKPDVVRVLTTGGKAQMYRKCCAASGKIPSL
jgi:hypothetical protein